MKMKQAYKRTIIAYAVFSAIYQIVFVLAVYYLHDASGETIMYYAFPDISQLEEMGISPALSVLFYVMIIAALFWPVVMLGIIRRAIVPERTGRTAAKNYFLIIPYSNISAYNFIHLYINYNIINTYNNLLQTKKDCYK